MLGDSQSSEIALKLDVGQLYHNPNTIDLSDSTNLTIAMKGDKMDALGENLGNGTLSVTGVTNPK